MDESMLKVTQTFEAPGVRIEEVIYPQLTGSEDLNVAEKIFFVNQAEIRLKMLRATLKDSSIRIEPGALYFMKGKLTMV